MKVLMRTTATGSEYWDVKEKRTLFVPVGKEPEFEVTKNPDSMIYGVDLASGKDLTVVDGKINESETEIELDKMDLEQLLAFAEVNGIDVPGNMKKEDTIRNYIAEKLEADEE